LKYRKTEITTEHKLMAAKTLAALVKNPSVDNIIPSPLEK
jgi:malic enzyme